jgi:hypothetical protein
LDLVEHPIRRLEIQPLVVMVEVHHLRQLLVLRFQQLVVAEGHQLRHLLAQEAQVQLVLMAQGELHGQTRLPTAQMVLAEIRAETLGPMAALQIRKQAAAAAVQVVREPMQPVVQVVLVVLGFQIRTRVRQFFMVPAVVVEKELQAEQLVQVETVVVELAEK